MAACESIRALDAVGEIKDDRIRKALWVQCALWENLGGSKEISLEYAKKCKATFAEDGRVVQLMEQLIAKLNAELGGGEEGE